MSETLDEIEAGSASAIALESLYLHECAVERGDAQLLEAGRVVASNEVRPHLSDDTVTYTTTANCLFFNDTDELMVKITASFVAVYVGEVVPTMSEDAVMDFSRSVLLQVTPFMREFLATMTNRLGLPPFYLPLLHKSDFVEIDVDEEDT